MFGYIKNREEPAKRSQAKEKTQKPNFWDWLIHGTGSVSEPWPSVKEVLENPDVKKEIEEVQKAFQEHQKNGKK